MSRSQREKGARGEREAVELLKPVFPFVRRRCAGEETQGGRGRDLDGTPGWCVQVAVGARPPIGRKLAEAAAAAGYVLCAEDPRWIEGGERPLALTRRVSRSDRAEPWLATLRAEDLVALLERDRDQRLVIADLRGEVELYASAMSDATKALAAKKDLP